MKRNLLVTLADRNYLDQAKQLFSSAYWNGGWKGDYMLLAHEVPEKDLKWFRDKGILIYKCKPLYSKEIGIKDSERKGYPSTVLSKFYLFKPEFKKWKKIIFLDGDIIVRAPLDKLTKVKGFGAVRDINNNNLFFQFSFPNTKYGRLEKQKLKENFNLKKVCFNSGVFVFDTYLIKEDTFSKLLVLADKLKEIFLYPDQVVLNLFFYGVWKKISSKYNVYCVKFLFFYLINPRNIKGIILHFFGTKSSCPWNSNSPFYEEWKRNLKKAEKINLNKIPKGNKFSFFNKAHFDIYLIFIKIFKKINFFIGKMGEDINKICPSFYLLLKKIKNKIK